MVQITVRGRNPGYESDHPALPSNLSFESGWIPRETHHSVPKSLCYRRAGFFLSDFAKPTWLRREIRRQVRKIELGQCLSWSRTAVC